MTINEMKELALYAAKGQAPETFSVENVDAALADAMKEIAGSINQFRKNRYDIYEIITETADIVVPNKVIDAIGRFADVRTVGNGQIVEFKRRIGVARAKKFLTKAAVSGVYETFRLDNENITLAPIAHGGACTIDFERFLCGDENMAELMQIMTDALVDSVFMEVQKALIASFSSAKRPAANKKTHAGFDSDKMIALVNTVRAYGNGAVIFAAPEFVAAMGADVIVPVASGMPGVHSQDLDAIHNTGYINIFRGTPVVMFPQSYADENNAELMINPQYAYVLPTGGEKVVKVVFEGQTQIHDYENRDASMEIHMYRKMAAAIITENNWGIYQNTNLASLPVYEG